LAEQGHILAQVSLAGIYQDGKGVSQNDKEAAKWYRKAAERGHPAASQALRRVEALNGAPENP
jgi:TPR repeat protein